ncbi:hypothetical protein EBB79_02225 [Parasedimentitalea marina]|uniref:Uncharacterized protein n=1 Tax=Parasedimentitalea marina TaxID=2483033 RepID=A0A3T0MYJ2_9RHOB|nr:hypothetical protein [Parasedimentitalea marina]AZV76827.1 hypothetical protein EBB79_02225 [Parasedimentitalea marina]
MLDVAAAAISACLATAPDFEKVGTEFDRLGFSVASKRGNDVRWMDPEGQEAFVSELPGLSVCSVWFDGHFPKETRDLNKLINRASAGQPAMKDGPHGPEWQIAPGIVVRALSKQGDSSRFGAGVFVYGEN